MIAGIVIVPQNLVMLAVGLAAMAALHAFFTRTVVGQALRATAENPVAAQLMGIRVERMMALTFLLSGFLAGGAGVLVASIVYANFDLGLIGIKSFAAAVLGGFGHVGGAMAGGLLLGVVETIGAFYVSSAFKDIIAYTLLILILLLRPQGSSAAGPHDPTDARLLAPGILDAVERGDRRRPRRAAARPLEQSVPPVPPQHDRRLRHARARAAARARLRRHPAARLRGILRPRRLHLGDPDGEARLAVSRRLRGGHGGGDGGGRAHEPHRPAAGRQLRDGHFRLRAHPRARLQPVVRDDERPHRLPRVFPRQRCSA